ncbi:hypothetical protein [Paraburkholderia unamae]|uniref:hypothetical protein n=1 Tax=Paraburkholderia unamae TaxID=219649 RepID=UPI001CC64EA9|nr:hypothetical protein [Paraburkholderia unamae]
MMDGFRLRDGSRTVAYATKRAITNECHFTVCAVRPFDCAIAVTLRDYAAALAVIERITFYHSIVNAGHLFLPVTDIKLDGFRAVRAMAHRAARFIRSAVKKRPALKAQCVVRQGQEAAQAVLERELLVVALQAANGWRFGRNGVALCQIVKPRFARERRNDWARRSTVTSNDIPIQRNLSHAPIKVATRPACFRNDARAIADIAVRHAANQGDHVTARPHA